MDNETRDYNGKGNWSLESVERRFKSYSKIFGTTLERLEPHIYEEGSTTWIYPLADAVIDGIKSKDAACVELGIELIEESASMPFGMTLKSNTARALRQSAELLTEDQRRRIRRRVADMLIAQYMPREFVQYVKLARKIGFDDEVPRVRSEADFENRWVRHYLDRLTAINRRTRKRTCNI
jgi:hypothetical protein